MASIRDYWIEELQEIKEMQDISNIEDKEFLNLNQEVTNLIDDQFIEVATEKGISRREKMLKIVPFADDSLEDRRFRVGTRWDEQLPYTYTVLINKLDQMCGQNGYTIELNNSTYTLKIKIELTQKRMFDEARLMARRVSPANILIDIELRYNQYKTLSKFKHDQLSIYTHNQLRNEVIR